MATPSTEIEVGDFLIDIRKSVGSSGKVQVYPGTHKKTGQEVAAKKFTWLKDFPTTIVDEEVQTMRSIPDDDHTLKIVDYIKIDIGEHLEIWIILELCKLGDLAVFARRNKLTLCQKTDLMLQVPRVLHIFIIYRRQSSTVTSNRETYWLLAALGPPSSKSLILGNLGSLKAQRNNQYGI